MDTSLCGIEIGMIANMLKYWFLSVYKEKVE